MPSPPWVPDLITDEDRNRVSTHPEERFKITSTTPLDVTEECTLFAGLDLELSEDITIVVTASRDPTSRATRDPTDEQECAICHARLTGDAGPTWDEL